MLCLTCLQPVMSNLNLKIPGGKVTALVGLSGGGIILHNYIR